MTPTDFFNTLGAPLKGVQWSWGARREGDGTVFMRVWQDEIEISEGSRYVRLTNSQTAKKYKEEHDREKLGYRERLDQIEFLRNGAKCYLVMCIAAAKEAIPRKIKDFDKDRLFPAGRIVQRENDWWAELLPPVRVHQVKLK